MSTLVTNTITGLSTAANITIGSTPVVSASATSLTIRGEGSAQTSVQQGLAKAWGHYEGDQTAALQDSFNMAGITDLAAGRHSVTYTNNMANVYYAASLVGSTQRNGQTDTDSHAATGITFEFCAANSDTFTDSAQCQFHVMGDLA
jgi:hypothetical protein